MQRPDVQLPDVKLLSRSLLANLCDEAQASDRKRKNYNFHEHSERVQRFLNVLQPGTYVRPHRHLRSDGVNGFEFFLVLQGEIGMLVLDESGAVLRSERLEADGEQKGIELAEGLFHTLVVLEPNSVILELKEGPYQPATDKDFLQMFPSEGSADCAGIVRSWEMLFRNED
jgi:cupin fold WbuC family metalloprotein